LQKKKLPASTITTTLTTAKMSLTEFSSQTSSSYYVPPFLVASLLLLWCYKNFRWTGRGPFEYPIFGALGWVIKYRSDVLTGMMRLCQEYEWRTFSIKWFGERRMVITTDPACVEYVLKTNFDNYPKGNRFNTTLNDLLGNGIFAVDGEKWKAQRHLMSHVFTDRAFRTVILGAFIKHMRTMRTILDKAVHTGQSLDMQALLHRFTLDSIGEIAFGVSLHSLEDPDQPFVSAFDNGQAAIDLRFFTPGWRLCALRRGRGCLRSEVVLDESINVLRNFTDRIIDERLKAGDWNDRPDVLSRAMAAIDEKTGKPLYRNNNNALRDIILNFMIAGRDTTAQALSWALFEIARAPTSVVSETLAQEARAIGAADDDWSPTYDSIAKELRFTKAVMMETLRLFPSVPKEWKEAKKNDTLPDGTQVYAGNILVYLPYVMGRRESLWGKDAALFNPSRFVDAPPVSPYKFTAFNAGPRACLGQGMAMVEASFVLAGIFARYELTLSPPTQNVIPMDSLTLPQRRGVMMKVGMR
jgi:cytochrome P450